MTANMILLLLLVCWMSQESTSPAITSLTEAPRHHQHPISNQVEFKNLRRRLIQKNTLQDKDNCSIEDEQGRESVGLELLEMSFASDFSEIPRINDELNHTLKNSGRFCNSVKHLKCNSNAVCGCVDGHWMGMKMRSIREDGVCRLAPGSDCVPHESLGLLPEGTPPLKCQTRSGCIIKGGGRICTEERVQTKLSDWYGENKNLSRDPIRFMQFVKEKASGGLCVCGTRKRKIRTEETSLSVSDSGNSVYLISYLIVVSIFLLGNKII